MNDYMRALHQRFFREPAYQNVREEIELLRQELRAQMDRQDREKLLKLTNLGIELREEISLAGFTEGFRLALGIAGEMEPYSFDDEEEERALRRMEREDR